MKKDNLEYLNFKKKYKTRLASELGDSVNETKKITTNDYETFKKTFMPRNLSLYEKTCNFAEKLMPIKPDKKIIPELEEAIRISHINTSPTGTTSFAALVSLLTVFAITILGVVILAFDTTGSKDLMFFLIFGLIMAFVMFIPLTKLPFIIANSWKMKASNQMVLSIFYIVTYMRHTPNLELAVDFAAEHLKPPLSLDFKKVIWDIETGKFDNVNESLDNYLEIWRKWNQEFIESTHLIQSSLYETSETRRQDALDKSLQVILDETYEKMLHFTHDLKSPMTTLHMLGIVLPILGLVILPLMTSFIKEARWYHLFAIYNIALPILVYYMGRQILSTRPTGYGGVDTGNLSAQESANKKLTLKMSSNKNEKGLSFTPKVAGAAIMLIFFFIAIIPLVLHSANPNFDYVYSKKQGFTTLANIDDQNTITLSFLDYREQKSDTGQTGPPVGPYGLGASLLSLFFPLALGLGLGMYYKIQTGNVLEVKERTKKLELEFASALFQLGNRLADGVPAEIAFGNVSSVMHGTQSGRFFEMVTINIVKLGMGVEDAIYDSKVGALRYYPSSIIESSMKVFIESSRKGPLVASQALITVAEYIKSMHRVDERLNDLMADIVSSMKSQISFLTPAIAGIVVGITSMITQILGSLAAKIGQFNSGSDGGLGSASSLFKLFGAGGVPTYYFQAIVGLYVVQITFILTILINGIQNGSDKLSENEMLAKNLIKSTLLYVAIAGIFTLIFSIIAGSLIGNLAST